jgi:hypothetical protein
MTTTTNRVHETTTLATDLRNTCLAFCGKLLGELQQTKAAILNEFRETFAAHEHLLRLALNEAEALAWQSGIPHLVFPTLAREKVQAAAAWHSRQESLQRNGSVMAFAA